MILKSFNVGRDPADVYSDYTCDCCRQKRHPWTNGVGGLMAQALVLDFYEPIVDGLAAKTTYIACSRGCARLLFDVYHRK